VKRHVVDPYKASSISVYPDDRYIFGFSGCQMDGSALRLVYMPDMCDSRRIAGTILQE
jgi:hypothetical protein